MVHPVLEPHRVTSPYGPRVLNGEKQMHKGIDYVNINDKRSVIAICAGVCVYDFDSYDDKKRWTDVEHSAGNMVVLAHQIDGKIYYVRYLHLIENFVKVNQKVDEGFIIGTYHDAGRSYGAHVHIDMWDADWKQIDPTPIMVKGFQSKGIKIANALFDKIVNLGKKLSWNKGV